MFRSLFQKRNFLLLTLPLLLYLPMQSVQKLIEDSLGEINTQTLLFIAPIRILIILFPILWYLSIDREKIKISRPSGKDLTFGFGVGLAMLLAIVGGYVLYLWQFDKGQSYSYLSLSPLGFFGIQLYFVLINPLVEEFNWRWFSSRKLEQLGLQKVGTAFLIAFIFGIHHYLTLYPAIGHWFAFLVTFFISGASLVWSALNYKLGNFWASYIAHALADVGVAIVCWHFLFMR